MKQIFLVILFSTMLFSAQKQIILGSYMEERNAIDGVQKLEANIEDSDKLSWLKKKGVIEAKYKRVGKYFVVYLMPTGDKNQLFRAYNGVERYYKDAYVVDYQPSTEESDTKVSRVEEPVNTTQTNEEEMVVLKTVVKEEVQKVETEVEIIEDENEYASDLDMQKIKNEIEIIDEEAYETQQSQELQKEVIAMEEAQLVDEPKVSKEKITKKVAKVTNIETKETTKESNYFLEILLVFLVLLGVGYIIYKNKRKKGEELQEIQLEEK